MSKPVALTTFFAAVFFIFYAFVLNDGMDKCQDTHTFDVCASTLW